MTQVTDKLSRHAKEDLFRVYMRAVGKICDSYAVSGLHNFEEFSQPPKVFRWGYVNMEKSHIPFIQYFSKINQ